MFSSLNSPYVLIEVSNFPVPEHTQTENEPIDYYYVKRSCGKIENGWVIINTNPILLLLHKTPGDENSIELRIQLYNDDDDITKNLKLHDFLEYNPSIKFLEPLKLEALTEKSWIKHKVYIDSYMQKHNIPYTFTYE